MLCATGPLGQTKHCYAPSPAAYRTGETRRLLTITLMRSDPLGVAATTQHIANGNHSRAATMPI